MFGLNRYLLIALLGSALVAFSGWQGYKVGKDRTNVLWLAKQAAENAAAAKRISELQDAARAKESLASVKLSTIQNELSEAQNEISSQTSELNRIYADIKRLRFQHNALQANGGEGGAVTANSEDCGGKTQTIFSREIFEYLYAEATRADEIVNQLNACQDILILDREVINE